MFSITKTKLNKNIKKENNQTIKRNERHWNWKG